MMSDHVVGGRAVDSVRPPRLLLAVNRPSLETMLQTRADCRVVANVRDMHTLQDHMRPGVAEVLVLARGFLQSDDPAGLGSVPAAWKVVRVSRGFPRYLGICARGADGLEAAWLAYRLRRST